MTAVIRYPVLELIINGMYTGLNLSTHEHMIEMRQYYANLGYCIRIEREPIEDWTPDANYPVTVTIER